MTTPTPHERDPATTAEIQTIVDEVIKATSASRVTVRLEDVAFKVVAEALLPDVLSLKALPPPTDVRADPVARQVFDTQEIVAVDVVEDDLAPDDPRQAYRIRAEIVAPIVDEGRTVGALSVHEVRESRQWSPAELLAVQDAAAKISGLIGSSARP